jgi:CubicO group peptidase (beta-lactamase class C family)
MPVEGERFHDAIAERSYAISSALSHPELGIPYGSFTVSGNGGQRLTVIPSIETIVVNLMNTDVPSPRTGSDQWDVIMATVVAARRP